MVMERQSSPLVCYITRIIFLLQEYKFPLFIIVSFPLTRLLYLDYVDWLRLGPGGIPHNPMGFMAQCVLRFIASRDLRSTVCYQALKTTPLEKQSFMDEELPDRRGWTPKTGKWCIPHRQLSETATEDTKQVRRQGRVDRNH